MDTMSENSKKKIAALTKGLSSRVKRLCIDSLEAVPELGDDAIKVMARVKALCAHDDAEIRSRALRVARTITAKDPYLIAFFSVRLIEDEHDQNRVACAYFITEKLSESEGCYKTDVGQEAFSRLIEASRDADPRVRRHVIDALGYYKDREDELLPRLGLALDDKDESVRLQAVKGVMSCCSDVDKIMKVFRLRLRYEKSEAVLSLIANGLESLKANLEH
jgi:hypothetical protein